MKVKKKKKRPGKVEGGDEHEGDLTGFWVAFLSTHFNRCFRKPWCTLAMATTVPLCLCLTGKRQDPLAKIAMKAASTHWLVALLLL